MIIKLFAPWVSLIAGTFSLSACDRGTGSVLYMDEFALLYQAKK